MSTIHRPQSQRKGGTGPTIQIIPSYHTEYFARTSFFRWAPRKTTGRECCWFWGMDYFLLPRRCPEIILRLSTVIKYARGSHFYPPRNWLHNPRAVVDTTSIWDPQFTAPILHACKKGTSVLPRRSRWTEWPSVAPYPRPWGGVNYTCHPWICGYKDRFESLSSWSSPWEMGKTLWYCHTVFS